MKKIIILVLTLFFSLFYVSAQEKTKHSCGSDAIHLKLMNSDNSYKEKFNKNNEDWEKYLNKRKAFNPMLNKSTQTLMNTPKTLTVVFHDVRNDSSQPFLIDNTGSYQYIVDKLNLIYDGTNLGGKLETNDTGIQFCLAIQDKNVNSYVGAATHHFTGLNSIDNNNQVHINQIVSNSGSTAKFPTKKYINIYVVDDIVGDVAGFAFLPSSHGETFDGIFIERAFLRDNSSLDMNMNVLAHEMGHYLGLFHVFGICDPETIVTFPQCSCDNTNPIFNGDMVADTAPMELNFTCSPAPTSCGSSTPDDKSNYMDYVDNPNCVDKFTQGQIDRMHFMIDDEFGARNSLLGTNSCEICTDLFNCNFTIQVPNTIIANEVLANTPLIFNVNTNCSSNSNIIYTWELTNLDTNSVVSTGNLFSFNQTIATPGNYKLTLEASLSSNPNCIELANEYKFKVIPIQGNSGPGSGTDYCQTIPDMNWTNFERVQYENGWSIGSGSSLTNYTWPSTQRYVETDANFDPNSFDIINPSSFSDVNFPLASIAPFGVNKIVRVGRIINQTNVLPSGAAYYVKVRFKPTPDNCKFLIHYLGMKQNSSTLETASLGFLVQLSYESPLDVGNIKHIGQSEWGNKWEGSNNLGAITYTYDNFNKLSSNADFTSPDIIYGQKNYKTTVHWKSKLLDFSEFAILNQGTNQNFEVTLTFFVRTNDQASGNQQAYAYYGIQCLGGGMPNNFDFNVTNYDMPCEFPETNEECIFQSMQHPVYFPNSGPAIGNGVLNSTNYAFGNYTKEYSDDDITYYPYFSNSPFKFCKGDNAYPFRYFRVTYSTFTQTIVKKFRITNQFFHNEPPCDPAIDIGGVNTSDSNLIRYFCSGDANYTNGISFSDPCFSPLTQPGGVYQFRWKINGAVVNTLGGASSVNYTALNNYLNFYKNFCVFDLKREVKYIDPYCGATAWYETNALRFYNVIGHNAPTSLSIEGLNDFCLNDNLSFTIKNFKLTSICPSPPPPFSSSNNNIVVQLVTPNGLTSIGAPQTIPITNFNTYFDINFNIPNDNGDGTFLFMPGTYGLSLNVTMNLFGCTKTVIINSLNTNINFDVSPIALPGSIELGNACEYAELDIVSIEDGVTNIDYVWEYSSDGGVTYQSIPNAPGFANLDDVSTYSLNLPVLIRRKSNEFPLCSNPAYTNPVLINPFSTPIILFDLPESLCVGSNTFTLPSTSSNGITGSWNVTTVDPSISGVYNYVFTPDSNQCVDNYTYSLSVLGDCNISISWNADVGCQLSENENNHEDTTENVNIVDGDCIRVCENSIITYTLNGSVGLITNTEWFVTGGTILSSSNTTCEIQWNVGAASYALQGTIYLNDFSVIYINKCIEKVNSPIAQIGILPNLEEDYLFACLNNPINFQNLSLSNGGNENLYYLWDFGDGSFSTEFEPSHIYTHLGEYNVTLTVSNGCSCVAIDEIKLNVVKETIEITCPSVACEGQLSIYSIESKITDRCRDIKWSVLDGQIVGADQGVSSVEVIWDHIDNDGFGYVFVESRECFKCISSIKIPVIKNIGTIVGETNICMREQHLYTLPQWPTTEFNWSLEDNGTGATLVVSNQRNEIFINPENPGTIVLNCQYYNTLLNCGGNASLIITVTSELFIVGPHIACVNETESYEITHDPGNPPVNLSYTVNGPQGFSYTGNSLLFDVTYPEPGIYTFSIESDNYCDINYFEVKVNAAAPPVGDYLNPNPNVICAGVPVDFYAATVTPEGTIHWSTDDGTILGSSIGNHITVVFDPRPYYYQLTVWTEVEGCVSELGIIEVYNQILDTQIQSNDINVCGSSTGTYSTNETDSELYIWSIQPAEAGSIVSGQNTSQVEILWNQEAMPANVRLTLRKCGNDYIGNLPVTITPTPILTISPTVNPVCTGSPGASFSLSLDPATSFSSSTWDFGDNTGLITFPAGTPITHVYNDPLLESTLYNVTATVQGVNNCMFNANATTQITIAPSPIIAVTPNRNYNLCEGIFPGYMNYSVTLQNGVFATSTVEWYRNGILVSNDNPTINASLPGIYYAIVTNEEGCTSITPTYQTFACESGTECATPPLIVANQTNTGCQQIEINITDPGAATGFTWGNLPGSNAIVITQNNSQYVATNLSPGLYQMPINPTYSASSGYCEVPMHKEFIIPYSAGLKYNVQCNNGDYTLNLLDYSQYYAGTPIETFEFTINGGASWTTASSTSTFTTVLPPGNYQLGIRIGRAGYHSCTSDFIPLNLPGLPNADFAVPSSVCLNTPMQFIPPTNTDPDLVYKWTFGTNTTNLQPNPVMNYSSAGSFPVTLTVTNRFGCASSVTKNVQVIGQSYDNGSLSVNPQNNCVGENLTISYDAGLGNSLPYSYIWYHNEITDPPFAVTTNYNNELTVNQPGQYFVYVADANGCITYDAKATSAHFIPTPPQPLVTGTAIICKGANSRLEVPENPSVIYKWWLNGVPQSAWDNDHIVSMTHTTVGTYLYEVVAEIQSASGSFCSSEAASFTVDVIDQPDVPVIDFTFDSCSPYHATVFVTNPQVGIEYHWSNGQTGVSTEMIHDGPIRVSAKSSSCEVSAQIDLPLDLYMHTWYYPRGCYKFCDTERKEDNYIIGPLVAFQEWQWLHNDTPIESGSGQVAPLTTIETGTYQLYLQTPYCNTTLSDISIDKKECTNCEIDFQIAEVTPTLIKDECLYLLNIYIGNPSGNTLSVSITSIGLDGYFAQSSFAIPPGGAFYPVYFYPLNGYVGGTSFLSIHASIDSEPCYTEVEFELPPLCEGAGKLIGTNEVFDSMKELQLFAAPNPAAGTTAVYFNYGVTSGQQQIEITDMYGRTLNSYKVDGMKGTLQMDCSRYEAGQYFILMKQNNQILKNCKLIIK